MTNLLEETKECIAEAGKTPEDIKFIGSTNSGYSCTWQEYVVLADVDYDDGFGGQEVATDLKVIFTDGTYMERGEYDGSEWWIFNKPQTIPTERKEIHTLITGSNWESLEEIHETSI